MRAVAKRNGGLVGVELDAEAPDAVAERAEEVPPASKGLDDELPRPERREDVAEKRLARPERQGVGVERRLVGGGLGEEFGAERGRDRDGDVGSGKRSREAAGRGMPWLTRPLAPRATPSRRAAQGWTRCASAGALRRTRARARFG